MLSPVYPTSPRVSWCLLELSLNEIFISTCANWDNSGTLLPERRLERVRRSCWLPYTVNPLYTDVLRYKDLTRHYDNWMGRFVPFNCHNDEFGRCIKLNTYWSALFLAEDETTKLEISKKINYPRNIRHGCSYMYMQSASQLWQILSYRSIPIRSILLELTVNLGLNLTCTWQFNHCATAVHSMWTPCAQGGYL